MKFNDKSFKNEKKLINIKFSHKYKQFTVNKLISNSADKIISHMDTKIRAEFFLVITTYNVVRIQTRKMNLMQELFPKTFKDVMEVSM